MNANDLKAVSFQPLFAVEQRNKLCYPTNKEHFISQDISANQFLQSCKMCQFTLKESTAMSLGGSIPTSQGLLIFADSLVRRYDGTIDQNGQKLHVMSDNKTVVLTVGQLTFGKAHVSISNILTKSYAANPEVFIYNIAREVSDYDIAATTNIHVFIHRGIDADPADIIGFGVELQPSPYKLSANFYNITTPTFVGDWPISLLSGIPFPTHSFNDTKEKLIATLKQILSLEQLRENNITMGGNINIVKLDAGGAAQINMANAI